MLYFIGDTETTGLGLSAEVIQFAGILADNDLKIKKFINFYCMPSVVIPREAINTHGITNEEIPRLSKGKFFEELIEEYPELYGEDITFIFYNSKFDIRIINQTLVLNGVPEFDFGTEVATFKESGRHNLCAMKTMANGRRKLVDLYYESFNTIKGRTLTREELNQVTLNLLVKTLKKTDIDFNLSRLKAHDALFDSYMTYFLVKKNRLNYE